jgi:site-specific DNA recombinase
LTLLTNVTMIPATRSLHTQSPIGQNTKRKVAAYARVSTGTEEQLTSYEAQVDYYTAYIQGTPDWLFAGVYTDEGISALSTRNRDGFNRMVSDALAGKIDLIVTKSVSRFARNTVDSLTTVRKLKQHKVEVFFEKENIYTFDGKGELLLTILSSLAQEESRSISDNVKWGQRKRFADGKVSLPYKKFLGYEKGEDGRPAIVESEAVIVRMIYRLFMEGMTPSAIAKRLMEAGILTPGGKMVWQVSTVKSILTNEKYRGDAILQKSFTVDFLTKKKKANEGEVPKYFVENSHDAIIDPVEFDAVQAEMERRKKLGRPSACNSPLSARIVCGDCGGYYGAKVWCSTSKYRRVIWRCNEKYKREEPCSTPHVTEEDVRRKFVSAFNSVLSWREGLLDNCRHAQNTLCDCAALDAETAALCQEIGVLEALVRGTILAECGGSNEEGAPGNGNPYIQKLDSAIKRQKELESLRREKQIKRALLDGFIRNIEESGESIGEFDERLWAAVTEKVTVMPDGALVFSFRDGTDITIGEE